MKALTICQPWAHLVIHGVGPGCAAGDIGRKDIENRTQRFSHRGLLAVHAGLSRSWMDPAVIDLYGIDVVRLTFGAVIGVVDLHDCVKASEVRRSSPWIRRDARTYCLMLRNPRAMRKPVKWSGQQGLFEIPDGDLVAGDWTNGAAVAFAAASLFGGGGRML